MQDRRQLILDTALAVLREQGLSGFTQPRIARGAGLRQSHLTYYYPTRLDLLAAVTDHAVDALLTDLDRALDGTSPQHAAASIAGVVTRPDNTRVLMALAEAADAEPTLQATFRRLQGGIAERAAALVGAWAPEPAAERLYILHALSVGLAVINLAIGEQDGARRAEHVLGAAFGLLFPTTA